MIHLRKVWEDETHVEFEAYDATHVGLTFRLRKDPRGDTVIVHGNVNPTTYTLFDRDEFEEELWRYAVSDIAPRLKINDDGTFVIEGYNDRGTYTLGGGYIGFEELEEEEDEEEY